MLSEKGGVPFKLRVLSFNIRHGLGTDRRVDLHRIAKIIKQSDADIIGLNEVDKSFSKRSHFIDQASWLAEQLQMEYVFAPAISIQSKKVEQREYGNALFSRFPIKHSKSHIVRLRPFLCEPRSIIDATIQINQTLVKTLVTHFSLHPLLRKKQMKKLVEEANSEHPTILMGDLNCRPYSRDYREIAKYFHNTCDKRIKKELGTFPSRRPKVQLDYIFVNDKFEVIYSDVITTYKEASDHLPITSLIKLNNNSSLTS
ncbi:endonuclease/exonuclease/phosphatase family protein [Alkalihalobacterium chitinilyticum]|uniref:Endonuclease/exonuclease/phosphatase family protein n=1 Tax=Alkalihalobacterium chitinilyticum TaxID=2980103 RepID=A0ABT5VK81_9BACI|nr:endonuclease/exonuclease/phosphatase family protein [Alkalihalobacterium chitinilyticum]MDE5414838.1 endonuclease/exonuclease/phosphatase family protein [Alkalihalobacterium chitinilyticum]